MFAIFAPWVVALTGVCKTLLSCASGSWTAENHARSRPLKRLRTSEVLAEIEVAVTRPRHRQPIVILRVVRARA